MGARGERGGGGKLLMIDDLMDLLAKVFTKRFIQIGFWVVAVGIAVGILGQIMGWWHA